MATSHQLQNRGELTSAWNASSSGLANVWSSSTTTFLSLPTHGQNLVKDAIKDGALSAKGDKEMLQKVQKIVSATVDAVIGGRERIEASITRFKKESDELNEELSSYAKKLMSRLSSGQSVDTAEADNLKFMVQTAQHVAGRFFETAQQLMELQKMQSAGLLTDYQGAIDLVFYARTKELDLLKTRLEILQKQEDHELKIMIALQDQQLKEESQRFDQIMSVAKFVSEEEKMRFEKGMELRKHDHQKETDLLGLALQEKKMGFEHQRGMKTLDIEDKKNELEYRRSLEQMKSQQTVEILKQKNHKQIETHRISSDKETKLQEIDANARVETVKAIAGRVMCLMM
jgi:hypothetical protein